MSAENPKPTHTIREMQLRLLGILEALDAVLKRHGIPYWLESGTALGAARHKGFMKKIPR